MPRLRYLGRDEEGEPLWSETKSAPQTRRFESHHKTQAECVLHGYKQLEDKGWRSAYSKQDILKTWKES